jgi:hypothetical protein
MPGPPLEQAGLKRGKTSKGERAYVVTAKGEKLGLGKKGDVLTPKQAQSRAAEKAGVNLNIVRSKKADNKAKAKTQPAGATQTTTITEKKAKPLVSKAAVTAQDVKRKAAMKKAKARA